MRKYLAFFILWLLTSCGTSPDNSYYTMTSEPVAAAHAPVSVATIILPAYLDRPQIVTRAGEEINVREFERWDEPLDSMVRRVLNEDLGATDTNRKITVTIEDFILDEGSGVTLKAHWKNLRNGLPVGTVHNFSRTIPVESLTPDAVATTMGHALHELAIALAKGG